MYLKWKDEEFSRQLGLIIGEFGDFCVFIH